MSTFETKNYTGIFDNNQNHAFQITSYTKD